MKLAEKIQKIADKENKRMEAVREEASIAKAKKDEEKENPDIDEIIRNLPALLEKAALDGCHTGIHTLNVMTLSEKNHLVITDSMTKKSREQPVSGMDQITVDILLEDEIGIRNVLQKSVIPLIDYLESEGFEVSIKSQNKDIPELHFPIIDKYISVSW